MVEFFKKLISNFKIFLFKQTKECLKLSGRIVRGILASLIVLLCLTFIFGLFGYKVDLSRSLTDKIISKFVVLSIPPRARLFTQYKYEYGLSSQYGHAFISDGKKLKINNLTKPLWIGVWNDESRNLQNVRLIIYLPKGIEVINKEDWKYAWIEFFINEQYEYIYNTDIYPNTGRGVHPPIQIKFPRKGVYEIKYAILTNDFSPFKGNFLIAVQ